MATQRSIPEKLSVGTKIGYGAGELGSTLFWSTLAALLLAFLTDDLKLVPYLAGIVLMSGKIWDAVTDPTVGYLSDRTRTRWGKRRPWFLFGAVPLGLAFFWMFRNPNITGETPLFIWALFSYMVLFTAYTVVNIPYIAMIPDLSKDFDERTNINAYRSIFSVTGVLVGAGASLPIVLAFENRSLGFMIMAAIFGGIMALSAVIPFFAVKEPPLDDGPKPRENIFSLYLTAVKNRPYMLVAIPWSLNTAGVTVVMSSLFFYFKYIFGNEALMPVAMIVLLVTAMVFLPLTVKLAKVLDKRNTYLFGMLLVAAVLIVMFFLGHRLGVYFVYGCMFVAGIGVSTHFVMPWSMVPDTVEHDYVESGQRREGIYFGFWTFLSKIGAAVAGLVSGLLLDATGFIPDVVQTETAELGIRLLAGPTGAIFFIIAGIILVRYPIDKKRYDEIMEKVRIMEAD
ncbi:MAG: MFS transporter [Deltaproteobacteria bacterium]|nr:MFS transporter [Candidatus Zymogenaceae bacterium]